MEKIADIQDRIKQIQAQLFEFGEMRVGSLTTQKRSWGGEYLQLSYTHKGKGRTQYVRQEDKEQVERQIRNYKLFKELTSEWIDLSMEILQIQADASPVKRTKKR